MVDVSAGFHQKTFYEVWSDFHKWARDFHGYSLHDLRIRKIIEFSFISDEYFMMKLIYKNDVGSSTFEYFYFPAYRFLYKLISLKEQMKM